MDNLTDLEMDLCNQCKKIFDDEDFILGVLLDCRTEKDQKAMLAFINSNQPVSAEAVVLYGMYLADLKGDN